MPRAIKTMSIVHGWERDMAADVVECTIFGEFEARSKEGRHRGEIV